MNSTETATTDPTTPAISQRRIRMTDGLRSAIPLVIAIIALGAFATSRSEFFFTTANAQNLLDQIAVLGVLAVGTTFLMIGGQLDLSIGSVATVVTIVIAKLIEGGTDLLVAVAIGILVGVVIGIVTGLLVAFTNVAPFILTLGSLSVFASVALILSKQQPIPIGLNLSSFAVNTFLGIPIPFWVFFAALIVGGIILRFTRLGRAAYAVGANEEAAYISGVPVKAVKVGLSALNGVTVGVAGMMLAARLGSGDPTAGVGLELQAIAAVVLGGASLAGGRGWMTGTFLGVLLLGLVANSLTITGVQSFYQQMVLGLVLIIAVVGTALLERQRRSGRSLLRRKKTG
jgi:ribose/xylose/arabinose/galactoside ABC-type transport system permease subunit